MNKFPYFIIYILLLNIFLVSCDRWPELVLTSADQFNFFKSQMKADFYTSGPVRILDENGANTGIEINSPPMAYVPLLEAETNNGIKCLSYRVPYKSGAKVNLGILAVYSLRKWGECWEHLGSTPDYSIESVDHLTFYISDSEILVNSLDLKIQPYVFELHFYHNDKNRIISFPLINLEKGKLVFGDKIPFAASLPVMKRFSSSASAQFIPGVHILNNNEKFGPQSLGRESDNYADKTAKICHQIDEQCNEVSPSECERCRYGWFYAISARCKNGGSKYCGVNRCGEKGQPACLRGIRFENNLAKPHFLKEVCSPDTKVVFCQKGLVPFCDENQIVICL